MKMNMIDYNKAVEALEKERQYLLNREQYGAENVLVKHAINVIHYLPIIRQPEVIRCKDCKHWSAERINDFNKCRRWINVGVKNFATMGDWFCADGERRSEA